MSNFTPQQALDRHKVGALSRGGTTQLRSVACSVTDALDLFDKWKKSDHGQKVQELDKNGRIDEAMWLTFRQGIDSQNIEDSHRCHE